MSAYTVESETATGGISAGDKVRVYDASDKNYVAADFTAMDTYFKTGATAGTVTASKAVIVDSNKDIGDFRNLDATNFDAGASGTAGSVDIFPSTAAKGKIALTAADSAGDTTTTIVNASQAAARTYTIPDAGAAASFVMTEGTQTLNGPTTIAGTTVRLGTATSHLVGFHNGTGITQRAGAAQNTTKVSATSTDFNSDMSAFIVEVGNTLAAYGLWKGSA